MPSVPGLTVLVVDGEAGPRAQLEELLATDVRVSDVLPTDSGLEALRLVESRDVDAVFLDVALEGLSGLDVARFLTHFRDPPAVVFVTEHHEHAVTAFELNAADYLLKPVSPGRVSEAVRRIVEGPFARPAEPEDETIPVELAGVTRFVQRSAVLWVESHGDYARLHTADQAHLVRASMASLEYHWRDAGFARIHRQCLVSLRHVRELRQDGEGHCTVLVDQTVLVVARRHVRELRELLVRQSRPFVAPDDRLAHHG